MLSGRRADGCPGNRLQFSSPQASARAAKEVRVLPDAVRTRLADELARAEDERVAVSPLVGRFPEIDVVDAYEIQLLNIQRRLKSGAKVVGHKVGLSSKAMQ